MSDRQALRDLQQRLAQRLQAAHADAQVLTWLATQCAGRQFLFALPQAGEIFDVPPLLAVPRTSEWFAGVANLRGGLHAVVDLGCFFGLRGPAGEALRDGGKLVVLAPALGVQCALLVDAVSGLRRASDMRRMADDAQASRPAFATACWQDDDGRPWQELDLAAMAADPRFLSVAMHAPPRAGIAAP